MPAILQPYELLNTSIPLLDVRSEGEYVRGHIPGANNLPLFTDEERAVVGTLYNQIGKDEAFEKGLEIVGPKMAQMVRKARKIAGINKDIALYCWRGGMRSQSVGWLLETAGFNVFLLEGGYKAYRRMVLELFEQPLPLYVLGGYTGSGKTEILYEIKKQGGQIIDLEALAHHKGSAFGALGQPEQPSSEMFENELHRQLMTMNLNQPIWIEDESRNMGKVYLPQQLYRCIQQSPLFFIERSLEQRVDYLMQHYGIYPADELEKAIHKIKKRLGDEMYRYILNLLYSGKLKEVCINLLNYYDRAYKRLTAQRNQELVQFIPIADHYTNQHIAKILLDYESH
ncbi:MAG: tRNA 2-selenouridine(34) synthase MnmH [Flavobacteriales bacterium]|nr:tRNA 2-selenouridine(34) synthase MnmH [Flavobacteriales bacterium]